MNKVMTVLLGVFAALLVAAAILYGMRAVEQQQAGEAASEPVQQEAAARTAETELPDQTQPVVQPEETVPVLSTAKLGWGPGTEVNDRNQPTGALSYQEKYEELGGWFILPDDSKTIYLTFDLGYENGYTETILDALAQYGVKATFFVTQDYVNEAPQIVERILAEGHTLGNHTVKHPSMPDVSAERAESEVMELHEYVRAHYNYEMTLFRFPMGEFSEQTLRQLNDLGYQSVFWSFAYKDWITDAQPDPDAALARTTGALHDGAIYLLHAVSATNAQIMGGFLSEAQAQGYHFALLDERLGLVAPSAAQGKEEGIL